MVVTADGYFFQFGFDPVRGGECGLQKTYGLVEAEEEVGL